MIYKLSLVLFLSSLLSLTGCGDIYRQAFRLQDGKVMLCEKDDRQCGAFLHNCHDGREIHCVTNYEILVE